MGIAQEEIPARGPICQEEFLEIEPTLQKYLLVGPMTLKNLQKYLLVGLHIIGESTRGITRIIHRGEFKKAKPPTFDGE